MKKKYVVFKALETTPKQAVAHVLHVIWNALAPCWLSGNVRSAVSELMFLVVCVCVAVCGGCFASNSRGKLRSSMWKEGECWLKTMRRRLSKGFAVGLFTTIFCA